MTTKLTTSSEMESTDGTATRAIRRRIVRAVLVVVGASAVAQPAAAHAGSTHVGTPHWAFLVLVLLGGLIMTTSVSLDRGSWGDHPRRAITGFLSGLAIALLGTIAVVQIQIEPIGTTPTLHGWYPVLAIGVSVLVVTGSLLLGYWRWPTRPEYSALGLALGVWIGYPVLLPNRGYRHPLGYLLVGVVPLLICFILWRDVWPPVRTVTIDGLSRRAGIAVAGMFGAFFLFSAGLFTVNPERGVDAPSEAFVTTASFANPLVVWPAVEFYLPSIPLAGAMSVGTAVLIGVLTGLIGLNAALLTTLWRRDVELSSSGGLLGGLATTGATACCCCGPAVYAVASVFFGITASPLYWAFMDPSSPLGSLFFVAAVSLLLSSTIRFAQKLESSERSPSPITKSRRQSST